MTVEFQAMAENARMEISIVLCYSYKEQDHSVRDNLSMAMENFGVSVTQTLKT